MTGLIAGIGVAILKRLVTETFLSKVGVEILWTLAQSSKNKLDDKLVAHAAEALDIPLKKD